MMDIVTVVILKRVTTKKKEVCLKCVSARVFTLEIAQRCVEDHQPFSTLGG